MCHPCVFLWVLFLRPSDSNDTARCLVENAKTLSPFPPHTLEHVQAKREALDATRLTTMPWPRVQTDEKEASSSLRAKLQAAELELCQLGEAHSTTHLELDAAKSKLNEVYSFVLSLATIRIQSKANIVRGLGCGGAFIFVWCS